MGIINEFFNVLKSARSKKKKIIVCFIFILTNFTCMLEKKNLMKKKMVSCVMCVIIDSTHLNSLLMAWGTFKHAMTIHVVA